MAKIHGTVDPRFGKLQEAFQTNFADGLDHGASVAVMLDGKIVAELWGGFADAGNTRPWAQNTLVNVWSCTKAVVATVVAMAVERGQLQYDAPVARVWPEFAANGKERVTLDHVLSHQAGLNGFAEPVDDETLSDWHVATGLLAAQKPFSQPGEVCAYHALTYGHLAGEALRRASGLTVGQFIQQNINALLGTDFYVGVPEQQDHRCAEMIEGPGATGWIEQVLKSPFPQSCRSPTPVATWPNQRRWRAIEIPGGNGHATARGLASIYGDLVSGQSKLMRKYTLKEASRERFRGDDMSFQTPTAWAAGFRLEDKASIPTASRSTISHGGWGGSIGFGDPEAKLGFAYVTNRMLGFDDGIDPRRQRLVNAVYEAL
jgi:CubicO group peptidase (beta-lactamase class C family)